MSVAADIQPFLWPKIEKIRKSIVKTGLNSMCLEIKVVSGKNIMSMIKAIRNKIIRRFMA
jgi:hypothetical protein